MKATITTVSSINLCQLITRTFPFLERANTGFIVQLILIFLAYYQRPEIVEDFVRNFLVKMGMTRTLDCFQTEW